jgi:hypothetical protein
MWDITNTCSPYRRVSKPYKECANKGKKCKNTYCRNNERGRCTKDPR